MNILVDLFTYRFGLQRIQELQNVINRRKMLEQEAARDVNFAKLDPRNCETTDIDSEGIDLEQRVLNFSEITKRLKDHLSTTEFKGNDYNSNVYIRKLQKMAKNGIYIYIYIIIYRLRVGHRRI